MRHSIPTIPLYWNWNTALHEFSFYIDKISNLNKHVSSYVYEDSCLRSFATFSPLFYIFKYGIAIIGQSLCRAYDIIIFSSDGFDMVIPFPFLMPCCLLTHLLPLLQRHLPFHQNLQSHFLQDLLG